MPRKVRTVVVTGTGLSPEVLAALTNQLRELREYVAACQAQIKAIECLLDIGKQAPAPAPPDVRETPGCRPPVAGHQGAPIDHDRFIPPAPSAGVQP